MNDSISKEALYLKIIKNRCLTCFNEEEDVHLVPLIEKRLVNIFFPEITLTAEDLVCLDCDYMIKKMIRFRNTVLTAQLLLNNAYQQQCQDVDHELNTTIILKMEKPHIPTAPKGVKQELIDLEAQDPLLRVVPMTTCKDDSLMEGNKITLLSTKDNLENIPIAETSKNVPSTSARHDDDKILRDGQEILRENIPISTLKIMNDDELLAYSEAKRNHPSYLGMMLRCDLCIGRFRTQRSYDEHMQLHDVSAGDYPCGVCQQRFVNNNEMETHRKTHYMKFMCTKCDYEVNSLRWSIRHYKCLHLVRKQKCTLCDAVFDTFRELKNHKNMNHVSREKCIECGLMVRGQRELKMHMARHKGGIPMLECNICNKTIKLSSLKSHTSKFHKDNIKDAAYCKPCDVQFNSFKLYMSHMTTSRSPKHNTNNIEASFRHKCDKCDTNFETRASLAKHMQTKHSVNYTYQCDKCDKSFKCRTSIKRHAETVHERVARTKDLICDSCGKAFYQRNTLVEHMNTHTGARPHACVDCGATFGFKSALFTHRRLKHKVKRKKDLV